MKQKKLLGNICIEEGFITEQQLNSALQEGKEKKMLLGQVLLKKGDLSDDQLAQGLSIQLGYPYLSLKEKSISQEVISIITGTLAKRHKIIPLSRNNDLLQVAMTNPQDTTFISKLTSMTGYTIEPVVCTASDVLMLIDKHYGQAGAMENFLSPTKTTPQFMEERHHYTINDGPKMGDEILHQAINERIKEVHIEPLEESLRIRFRQNDTSLLEIKRFKNNVKHLILSNIKGRGGLDTTSKETSQKGSFTLFYGKETVEINISSVPVKCGECLCLRLSYEEKSIQTLPSLGADRGDTENIKKMLEEKGGTVFIAGPHGSGKTTTLYSIMNILKSSEKNIFSIENKIEHTVNGINQTEINPSKAFGTDRAFESVLQQNPDILLLDITINKKTIEEILRAALTQCLVIGTIAIKDSLDLFPFLSCLNTEPYILASAIKGIIGQKLFKKSCKNCTEKLPVPPHTAMNLSLPVDISHASSGKGCTICNNSGYDGNRAIFETLLMNDEVKKMLTEENFFDKLKSWYKDSELQTIKGKSLVMVRNGTLSLEEYARYL